MSTDQLIKIAIADDHKIFRDGIKMALAGKSNLKMLWEAEDGKDMMHKIAIKKPEVLLMDIRMPEIDGINGIQLIRKEYEDIKIIVLTMYDDQQMISKMMEMGANAYLTKTTDPEEIYEAIYSAMSAFLGSACKTLSINWRTFVLSPPAFSLSCTRFCNLVSLVVVAVYLLSRLLSL